MAKSVLVTGANRGIGLELIKQFLAAEVPPRCVIATCRDPASAEDLTTLKNSSSSLHILKFESKDSSSFENFGEQVKTIVGDDGLNLLINNAGMNPKLATLGDQDKQKFMDTMEVNVAAPMFLTRALLPLLKKAADKDSNPNLSGTKAAVCNISSIMGSIEKTGGNTVPHYTYRTSKAALNMVTKCLSVELAPEGVLVAAIHPGWVQTDMGGARAAVTPPDSAAGIISVISQLTETGWFGDYTGAKLPW